MRTFISVDIPDELRNEIKKIQNNLPAFIGKKTESQNLHLTLKFLGEVDDAKLQEIKNKLREIEFNKFEIEIDSVGVFSERFIRIIWLHLTNCGELQKEIDDKLKTLFDKEERFMSHLTIARVKRIKDKSEFLKKLNQLKTPKVKFRVEKFKLKSSNLTKHGPIYEILEDYYLNN